jgi:hypothetical protein
MSLKSPSATQQMRMMIDEDAVHVESEDPFAKFAQKGLA